MLKHKKYLLLLIFSIIIFYTSYILFPFNYYYDERWLPCYDLIENGGLYGNTPQCHQSLFFFLFLFIVFKIFGNNIPFVIKFLTTILYISGFYLIFYIIKKETKKEYLILPFIIYFSIYLIFLLNEPKDIGYILSINYILIGLILLRYKNKLIIPSILFTIAIMTKLNSLVIIALIGLFYLIENRKKLNYKNLLKLISPFLMIYGILLLKYPNMIHYTILANSIIPSLTYPQAFIETIKYLLNLQTISFIILLIFFTSLYIFIRKREVFSTISSFGLLFLLFTQFHTLGTEKLIHPRYTFIVLPFFIIAFIVFYDKIKEIKIKNIIFILLIIILVFPGLKFSYYSYKFAKFEKSINEIYHDIEPILNDITPVLTDERPDIYYHIKIKDYKVIRKTGHYDGWADPRLEYMGKVNLTKWKEDEWDKAIESDIYDSFLNDYNSILISPNVDSSDILKIISYKIKNNGTIVSKYIKDYEINVEENVRKVFHNILENSPYECMFLIPVIRHNSYDSNHFSVLLTKDKKECIDVANKYYNYLKRNSDIFCYYDEIISNEIYTLVKDIKGNPFKECINGGDIIGKVSNKFLL